MALPLTILSGYLGAGKTTLVNHLLRHANGQRLAIMVNEFGDLPIDADLIEAEGDDLIALSGGCVCCSYGDDLMAALAQLQGLSPAPDHLILEASGVALPGAIGASISLVSGIDLQGIIVLADAERVPAQLTDTYIHDTVERQIAAADLILLNKTDLVTPSQADAVQTRLTAIAPAARIIGTTEAAVSPAIILSTYPADHPDQTREHVRGLTVETRTMADPVEPEAFATALAADPTLLRAKGHLISAHDGTQHTLQMVGARYRLTPAPPGAHPSMVIIRLAPKTEAKLSSNHATAPATDPP